MQVNCTVHVNSTVNCTVPYFLQSTVHEKQVFIIFPLQRFKRKNHVSPKYNKLFFYYQIAMDCVLNKTQPRVNKQNLKEEIAWWRGCPFPPHLFVLYRRIHPTEECWKKEWKALFWSYQTPPSEVAWLGVSLGTKKIIINKKG